MAAMAASTTAPMAASLSKAAAAFSAAWRRQHLEEQGSGSIQHSMVAASAFATINMMAEGEEGEGTKRAKHLSRLSSSGTNIEQQIHHLHFLAFTFTCVHNAQRLKRRALISRISRLSKTNEGAAVPV
ncbi:hypothetical protein H4Q26_016989 [Puccinia striiformis f. sp. tritici PST-130]|uniref:Uncharacterized protein n=1 Tax=Puccinia striiformis f. sp. tritici PST-78 TaxID=1165861 RepID=A0A0L0VHU5_9BASI|nr:hypothetical protein H4Q26_016989 [Puccinia striiformis f. sp. tritici PST-130]KNE98791.1 hypothetical protein PSTG_07978 [Puccinia striiformis f. sp. tritici PST-78]